MSWQWFALTRPGSISIEIKAPRESLQTVESRVVTLERKYQYLLTPAKPESFDFRYLPIIACDEIYGDERGLACLRKCLAWCEIEESRREEIAWKYKRSFKYGLFVGSFLNTRTWKFIRVSVKLSLLVFRGVERFIPRYCVRNCRRKYFTRESNYLLYTHCDRILYVHKTYTNSRLETRENFREPYSLRDP